MATYSFTQSFECKDALNYDGTNYYNPPILFIIDGKKFVTPFGTSDCKRTRIKGTDVYIVGENSALDYISLMYINLADNSVQDVYLHGDDLHNKESFSYGILDMDTEQQIKILSEWLQ